MGIGPMPMSMPMGASVPVRSGTPASKTSHARAAGRERETSDGGPLAQSTNAKLTLRREKTDEDDDNDMVRSSY